MSLTGSTGDEQLDGDEGADAVALSWQETELVAALKRLANARSQLAALEAEATAAAEAPHPAPELVAALTDLHTELEAARAKSRSRFSRSSARHRADALEDRERALLAEAGFADRAAFEAWRADPSVSEPVDPAVLDFARREVRGAEAAWLEIQAMELPDPPVPADGDEDDAPAAAVEPHRLAHPEAS